MLFSSNLHSLKLVIDRQTDIQTDRPCQVQYFLSTAKDVLIFKIPRIVSLLLNCLRYSKNCWNIFLYKSAGFQNKYFQNVWEQYHSYTANYCIKYVLFSGALFMLILKIYLTFFLAAKLLKILQKIWGCRNKNNKKWI